MQHYLRRCKHCGKAYTYCTYGNEDGCSMDYCGCCQTAIDNALAKIPVRYVKKFAYVTDQDEIDFLKNTFEEEKRKYEESKNSATIFCNVVEVVPSEGCKDIEHCIIDWVEYRKYVKYDGEIVYKVAMEYDTVDSKFTNRKYEDIDGSRTYYKPVNIIRLFDSVDCSAPVCPMSLPKGDMLYMDIK